MAVINIRKDGTVVDDMSKVTVPSEVVKTVMTIVREQKKKGEKKHA